MFGGGREMGLNNIYTSVRLRKSPCDHFRGTPAALVSVNRTLDLNKTHAVISHQDVTSWANPECGHMWKMTISGKNFPLYSRTYQRAIGERVRENVCCGTPPPPKA